MESLAYTYWVLAREAEARELRVPWGPAASLLAIATVLQGGWVTADPLAPYNLPLNQTDFDTPTLDGPSPQAARLPFEFEALSKLEKPDTFEEAEFVPAPEFALDPLEPPAFASETLPAVAAPPAAPNTPTLDPGPLASPPDVRTWAEQRLAARARARQAAVEAPPADRDSYLAPRSYYSRARLPAALKISPFNLVHRAYQGGLKEAGIPSYEALIRAYKTGKIAPEDLVRAGIAQGRLTAAELYDAHYLGAVASQLAGLR